MTEQDNRSRVPQLVLSLGKDPSDFRTNAQDVEHGRRKTLSWNLLCRRAVSRPIEGARVVVHGAHVFEGMILGFPCCLAGRAHAISLIPPIDWNVPHNCQS